MSQRSPMVNTPPSLHPLWSSLALVRNSGISLQDQIADFFRDAIVNGRLPRGRRVPSSRQLALEHGISRTTAIEAYEHLIAEGYLVSRQGAGVFIAEALPEDVQYTGRHSPVHAIAPPKEEQQLLRVQDGRNYQLPLAPGMPAIDQFPLATWARLSKQICREQPMSAIAYGDPQGELELREVVAEYLAVARGVVCQAHQVVIVSGTEQTLDFAASQVSKPGDMLWLEDPGYAFLKHNMAAVGLKPVAVPVDGEGLDVEAGCRMAPGAQLAMVFPTHQYPLGITMSMARREALLAWAKSQSAWIVEIEIDGDYRYSATPLPPLYALANGRRVIYCGSLSKPLAPGLRINYLVVPNELIGSLTLRPTLAPMLTQLVLARFSSSGQMAAHMRRMRMLYARRRALLLEALRSEAAGLLDVDNLPDGGLRVMAALRVDVSDRLVAERCLAAGLKVDPLSAAYSRPPRRSGLIIGFASTLEEQFRPAIRRLVYILRQLQAESRNSA